MSAALTSAHVQGAIDIISDESRWCQNDFAVCDDGGYANPWSKGACKWCAVGAVIKCAGIQNAHELRAIEDELDAAAGGASLTIVVNDLLGRDAVIARLMDARDHLASQEASNAG